MKISKIFPLAVLAFLAVVFGGNIVGFLKPLLFGLVDSFTASAQAAQTSTSTAIGNSAHSIGLGRFLGLLWQVWLFVLIVPTLLRRSLPQLNWPGSATLLTAVAIGLMLYHVTSHWVITASIPVVVSAFLWLALAGFVAYTLHSLMILAAKKTDLVMVENLLKFVYEHEDR